MDSKGHLTLQCTGQRVRVLLLVLLYSYFESRTEFYSLWFLELSQMMSETKSAYSEWMGQKRTLRNLSPSYTSTRLHLNAAPLLFLKLTRFLPLLLLTNHSISSRQHKEFLPLCIWVSGPSINPILSSHSEFLLTVPSPLPLPPALIQAVTSLPLTPRRLPRHATNTTCCKIHSQL